ncbi:MAG: type VI secretion system secreted protein VgrG [Flavobacteriales bacterium]|jgi:type VI secretion system secreted protein VgrG
MIRTSIFIGGSRLSDHDFSSVNINQKIGGHHTFEIRLRQDAKKGVLLEKTNSWIGETVNIGFDNHDDVDVDVMPVDDVFKGIVTSLELSRQSGTGELVVKGHSPTIVMDDGPHTQSFTDTGLQEIVDMVMKPYESAFPEAPSIAPEHQTAAMPYTVQYKESAFDFINRLASRYGEWFYYNGLNMYFGKPGGGETIDLDFGENGMRYFDLAVQSAPTKIELKAYDYRTNKVTSEDAPNRVRLGDIGNAGWEQAKSKIYTETPSVNIQTDTLAADLKKLAKRREQIAADEIVIMNGVSAACKICPGVKITVEDKSIGEDYGDYIVIRASHSVGQGGDYSNSFEAIPAELGLPPLSSIPEPPFCETQLAIVKDTNDPDSLGRVKVELLWQADGLLTPWIRVASPYTGKDKGFYVIPEIGDQVLVSFENNHPDMPYVLSGMYHGEAAPEWFDPENKFKGFKSVGRNELKFDDVEESIRLSAPKEMTLHAGNKITMETDGGGGSEIHLNVGDGTVKIVAKDVIVEASGNVEVKSKKKITLDSFKETNITSKGNIGVDAAMALDMAGLSIKSIAKTTAEISGAKVDVKGSAMVGLQGALVKIN